MLGEKIKLKGWERFRGGLDVKGIYNCTKKKKSFSQMFKKSMIIIFPLCVCFFFYFTGDMTGEYSIYTLYEGHEIMFHVSTLLPFSRDNRQQVNTFYFIVYYS